MASSYEYPGFTSSISPLIGRFGNTKKRNAAGGHERRDKRAGATRELEVSLSPLVPLRNARTLRRSCRDANASAAWSSETRVGRSDADQSQSSGGDALAGQPARRVARWYTAATAPIGSRVTIYVSSLADMPDLVRRHGVRDLVSIIQPDAQPPTPPEVAPERHYRCAVHDIVEPRPGEVLPGVGSHRRTGRLSRHLGWRSPAPDPLPRRRQPLSRSTAVALIAHVLHTGDPVRSANALRAASHYASPNRRIVALADSVMGFGGCPHRGSGGHGRPDLGDRPGLRQGAGTVYDADCAAVSTFPHFFDGRVTIRVGDITREDVDAVVNAANCSLMGGGGVDGAIHRAGGPAILDECRAIRASRYPKGLPTGKSVLTTGGRMPAHYVIHTVGPVYGVADAEAKLAACYRSSLRLAAEHELGTIAFPAISTGVYGYPADEAAVVSSQAIREFLEDDFGIREVRLVFFGEDDAKSFLDHQVLA